MSESPAWWAPIVQCGVWFVLMSLTMGWLARGRLRPPSTTTSGLVLQLPKGLLLIGLVATIMFGAFTVLAFGSPTGGPGASAIFLLFALMSGYIVFTHFMDRDELRADGLVSRKLLGGEDLARWADIRAVSYNRACGWLVLRLHNGRTLRLSVMLIGLPALAQALVVNVAPTIIADDAMATIWQTAEGEPPSTWMQLCVRENEETGSGKTPWR